MSARPEVAFRTSKIQQNRCLKYPSILVRFSHLKGIAK
jgi:hypothetical protein